MRIRKLSLLDVRAWGVLGTFDQYSPRHDRLRRIADVMKMFERNGARVTLADVATEPTGLLSAAVGWAMKKR